MRPRSFVRAVVLESNSNKLAACCVNEDETEGNRNKNTNKNKNKNKNKKRKKNMKDGSDERPNLRIDLSLRESLVQQAETWLERAQEASERIWHSAREESHQRKKEEEEEEEDNTEQRMATRKSPRRKTKEKNERSGSVSVARNERIRRRKHAAYVKKVETLLAEVEDLSTCFKNGWPTKINDEMKKSDIRGGQEPTVSKDEDEAL